MLWKNWLINRLGSLVIVAGPRQARFFHGQRCWRCDGTTQEAVLAEDLIVDGGTYGFVKSFCYLGDTLDGDGGGGLATISKIKNGWMKFRELCHF